jgi:toxin CcdB
MATRVVIPLVPVARKKDRIAGLNLLVPIEGEVHVLLPELMAATDRRSLGPVVTSLTDRHHEIVNAIDFLLQGF